MVVDDKVEIKVPLPEEIRKIGKESGLAPEPHIPGLKEILSLRFLGLFIESLWKIWLGKEEK
jgi:hypothetical protein